MLLADFIAGAVTSLRALYPQEEARGIVLMLCKDVLGTESYTHIIEPAYEIADEKLPPLEWAMARLREGEPIQYVLGYEEFCGHRFNVTSDVLIPRPETQMLVEEALRLAPDGARVLDLCTGSGCIAWSVAQALPSSRVTAADISPEALAVASSQPFDIPNKPRFMQADILGEAPSIGPFDLILSNPPYVMESEKVRMRRNVLEYEPEIALFVPDDDPLLFYRGIARWSHELLAPGGWGIAEINEALGGEMKGFFEKSGFKKTALLKDYFSKNRFILFQK